MRGLFLVMATAILVQGIVPHVEAKPRGKKTQSSQGKLLQRTYAVADLVIPVDGTGKSDNQTLEDTLMNLISNTVAPPSWRDVGGKATMQYYPLGMALVINQSRENHERIADLLTALRRLQDLEVAVELRLVKVSDAVLERMGVVAPAS